MSSTIDESVSALIINELTKTKYNELLTNGNVNENEIYLVTNDTFDADDNPIVNVGNPENDTDAANKQYVDITILDNLNSLSSTVSANYLLKVDIPTADSLGLSNYAAVSTVTNLSNSLSSYALSSDVTYVSSQVSGLPSTITSLSSTVSSDYALKSEIPTAEDLGLSNYAAVSTVTDLSNSLSTYTTLTISNDISALLNSDITYVSSQVSGIPFDISDISNSLSSYALSSDVTAYVDQQIGNINTILETI